MGHLALTMGETSSGRKYPTQAKTGLEWGTPRGLGNKKRGVCYNYPDALPRFARHAVVASFDQIHLRLSCPPFNLREI